MRYIIIAAIAMVTMSSCKNLVPYSDAVKTKYNLNDDQLKHIQFYLSDPIVLQHKVVDGTSTQVSGGKIKIINGEKVEEIIIPSGTPGVLVRNDAGKLEVSFEKGDDHFLRFGANPSRYETYVLLASDWKGKIGTVTYAGNKYYTSPGSADALLLIDVRKIANYQKNERVAKGRKVN
jgi:hypothetical protein